LSTIWTEDLNAKWVQLACDLEKDHYQATTDGFSLFYWIPAPIVWAGQSLSKLSVIFCKTRTYSVSKCLFTDLLSYLRPYSEFIEHRRTGEDELRNPQFREPKLSGEMLAILCRQELTCAS
jgi:hypothetical protein